MSSSTTSPDESSSSSGTPSSSSASSELWLPRSRASSPFLQRVLSKAKPESRRDVEDYLDPARWVERCIRHRPGQGPTAYQKDALTELVKYGRVGIVALHGVGKTAIAAWVILWFSLTRDLAARDWKCPTTASVSRQLKEYLWPEVHKWARLLDWGEVGRPPLREGYELLEEHLKLEYGSAFASSVADPEALEGAHADSLCYVVDEAKAVEDPVWDAIEGAFSGGIEEGREAYALAISTPGEPRGRLYKIARRAPGTEEWKYRHIGLVDAIAAGRVSKDWAEAKRKLWGEKSAAYRNRVLGQFASSDEDGVIPLAWVEAANERWKQAIDEHGGRPPHDGDEDPHEVVPDLRPDRSGVDVARSGDDRTVIAVRSLWVVVELRYSALEGTMETAGRAQGLHEAYPDLLSIVDCDGLGAGVFDRLWELGSRTFAFHARHATTRRDATGEHGFVDTRSYAWWHLRELLNPAYNYPIALPPYDLLIGDLTAPKWRLQSGSRYEVESKDTIRKRIKRSTDSGDAVVQCFFDPPVQRRGARMKAGGRASRRLDSPL